MRRASFYFLLLHLACASSLCAQNAFTNLDFESASIVPIPNNPPNFYLSSALPGWSGFAGTNQLNDVLYDDGTAGSANISIIDTNSTILPNKVIQGNYTVLLQGGGNPFGGGAVNASLSQTGLVPAGTMSLSFLGAGANFSASLGGVNLSLVSSPVPGKYYNLYKADVSAFAGQTNALTFTALFGSPFAPDAWLYLDAIQFSSQPIPEPSGLSLLVIGIVGLTIWRQTRRNAAS